VAAPALAARGDSAEGLASAFAAVRARLALVGLLFVLAAVAWASTADRMDGMDAGPGSDLGDLGWFLGVWLVMMAAMMLPAVSPTVALYSRMTRARGPLPVAAFTGGYLLVWTAAGAAAFGVFNLGREIFGDDLAWDAGGQAFTAAVIAFAAVYELTPFKRVCLDKCRSPLGFLLGRWRDGARGGLGMGVRHGAWCLGCCWALMAALFALGVMSVAWMAVVAGLITLEKTLPWRRAALAVTTVVLLVLAVAVLASPEDVPGLTVPGGTEGMPADSMEMMR
jgi:predicted metal-binding membrane protein